MSTRSQLGFYGSKDAKINDWKALLYVHSDGNPEVILPEILPFLQEWAAKRGLDDSEYAAARLLQHLANGYDVMMADAPRYKGILGYGISNALHGDIAYF